MIYRSVARLAIVYLTFFNGELQKANGRTFLVEGVQQ